MRQAFLALLTLFLNIVFCHAAISQVLGDGIPQGETDESITSRFLADTERIDEDIWGTILGSYRSGHHLNIGVSWAKGDWNIKSAGDLQNTERQSSGIAYTFRYT